jgi:hypothetical protein
MLSDFFPGCAPSQLDGVNTPPAHTIDQEFGDFFFAGEACVYRQLPPTVRAVDLDWVYYGKAAKSLDQARLHAARIFSYGRKTRGAAHRDVWKHLKGINQANYGISGFMQTGRVREVIEQKYVLGQQDFGALYVIDCREAEVLDVDALCAYSDQTGPQNGESEILFSQCLPPTRILGAGLYSRGNGHPCLVEVIANRNYQAPGPRTG